MTQPYYKAIAFDFDGTLVDTMQEYARIAAEEMAARYGVTEEAGQWIYLDTSGIPFFQQLEVVFGKDDRNDDCAKAFEERKAVFLETVSLDDDAREALSRLRALGISIAITSNNYQELVDRFVAKEPELFDLVLGFGEEMSKGPQQFSKVLNDFDVDIGRLLFVGDSLSDAHKANAFAIDFVAKSGTLTPKALASLSPKPAVFDTLTELVDRLEVGTRVEANG